MHAHYNTLLVVIVFEKLGPIAQNKLEPVYPNEATNVPANLRYLNNLQNENHYHVVTQTNS